MNTYRRLALFLSMMAWLTAHSAPASAAHRQVFLLGGQSNMVGTGSSLSSPLAQPYSAPLPEVGFYFGGTGAGTARVPANRWTSLALGSGSDFGPEVTFGHTLHATDPIGSYALIKYAVNGSNVSFNWNPMFDNNVYTDFQATVDDALQTLTDAGDTYEIVGMLWTQGVRDAIDGRNSLLYQTDLERLIADVRLRYRSDLPVFISRLSIDMTGANPLTGIGGGRGDDPSDLGLSAIRRGQENVALNDPLAFLIDTDGFGTVGTAATHFDTIGQIDLGIAFAESYFTNVVVPEPGTLDIGMIVLLSLGGRFATRLPSVYATRGPANK